MMSSVLSRPVSDDIEIEEFQWDLIGKLTADMRKASDTMSVSEARHLVDNYYQLQDLRIGIGGQLRSLADAFAIENRMTDEIRELQESLPRDKFYPAVMKILKEASGLEDHKWRKMVDLEFKDAGQCTLLFWLFKTVGILERSCQSALGRYAKQWAVGNWMQSICGIGPVISAGLLAHIDIRKSPTFGNLWSFAGLNPEAVWEKSQKRPWNAKLKTLCVFKAGECFVKVQNNKSDYYGKLFRARKDSEIEKNENGEFADFAAKQLELKNFGKTTEAYKAYIEGKLPKAHIHARARRYAVKMFLSHLHHVMFVDFYDESPPIPWVFEHGEGNHRHYLEPPNLDQVVGKSLKEMYV